MKTKIATVTLKNLNQYLQSSVPQLELVRGRGYFYFADSEESDCCVTLPNSIYVCYLRQQDWKAWTDDIDKAIGQFVCENPES